MSGNHMANNFLLVSTTVWLPAVETQGSSSTGTGSKFIATAYMLKLATVPQISTEV